MIGSVTKNGGRREMETYDRVCDQNLRKCGTVCPRRILDRRNKVKDAKPQRIYAEKIRRGQKEE